MEKVNPNRKSLFFALQILLALIGIGISFGFVFNMITRSIMTSKQVFFCFIHFRSFMVVVYLGSFGLLFNRGFFIGLNYFVAGVMSTLFEVAALYRNMNIDGQIVGLPVAILATFYGSILLFVMSTTAWLIHRKKDCVGK